MCGPLSGVIQDNLLIASVAVCLGGTPSHYCLEIEHVALIEMAAGGGHRSKGPPVNASGRVGSVTGPGRRGIRQSDAWTGWVIYLIE